MGDFVSKHIKSVADDFEASHVTPKRPSKFKVLEFDPRSPTTEIIRTPIAVTARRRGSCSDLSLCSETPSSRGVSPSESMTLSANTCSDLEAPLIRVRRANSVPPGGKSLHRQLLQRNLRDRFNADNSDPNLASGDAVSPVARVPPLQGLENMGAGDTGFSSSPSRFPAKRKGS